MKKFLSSAAKAACSALLFLVFIQQAAAQNAKPHYVVNNTANAQEAAQYTDLLKDFDFDQYRFYDKRRTIHVLNSNITVDLYSAKELLDIYAKPVSPLTIMDNNPKDDIAFLMYSGKLRIVTVKK
jgi:hypothetical protein